MSTTQPSTEAQAATTVEKLLSVVDLLVSHRVFHQYPESVRDEALRLLASVKETA